MPDILSFDDAIGGLAKPPHLLLGNGFSRACRNDIFAYDSLFNRADLSSLSPFASGAFGTLATTDFEVVMRTLRSSAILLRAYSSELQAVAQSFESDADGLREVLVSAIANHHPDYPAEIESHRYASCRTFLSRFKSIYTLNYDLLLYWALMQAEIAPPIEHDDGFRTPDDGPCEYVSWDISKTNDQNVFYLHGGLHLFDRANELVKYTWCNTGVRLIEQIRAALLENYYPLFVAEGESKQKYNRIRHSDYLSRSYRSFGAISGTLFIYGHSLADNDEHILKCIEKGKTTDLYVSLYGDPSTEMNLGIIRRAERMRDAQTRRRRLNVFFYDAASAGVWG